MRSGLQSEKLIVGGFLVLLTLIIALAIVAGVKGIRLNRIVAWSRHEVGEAIRLIDEKDSVEDPVGNAAGRPMLVVDITKSMVGFLGEAGTFFEGVQALTNALDGPEIFSYGAEERNDVGCPSDALLTSHTSLSGFFEKRSNYDAAFNRDACLFASIEVDSDRPFILVTDGVYSSPVGDGVDLVAKALDQLIEKGWYLGLFLFEAPYSCVNGDDRCLYSEALHRGGQETMMRGGQKTMMKLPCDSLPRPFYALTLSHSPDLVVELDRRLSSALGSQTYQGAYQIGPGFDALLAEPLRIVADQVGDDSDTQWTMFLSPLREPLRLSGTYLLNPLSVVEAIEWRLALDSRPWRSPSGWQALSRGLPEVVTEGPVSIEDTLTESDLWRDFPATLNRLRMLIRNEPVTDALATPELEDTFDKLKNWGKRPSKRDVLCTIIDQPGDVAEERDVDIIRTLYAIDARRAGRFAEAAAADSGIMDQRYRDVLRALSKASSELGMHGQTIPVPTDIPQTETRPRARPTSSFTISLDPHLLQQTDDFALYRLRFVPVAARLAETLRVRSTDDDGDPVEVFRTYRLADWLTMLVNRRLARIGDDPRLAFFITHPGKP